mgnify:CR=1 FL=1
MPDDPNTTQNEDSDKNSIPASSQEPTVDAPILPIDSEPAEAPSEAPEAPRERFSDESSNIPPSNSTLTEADNEQKTEGKQAQNEPSPEPVSESVQATEPPTAQISTNEPLKSKPEELPPSASLPEEKLPASPERKPRNSTPTEATPPVASSSNHMRELQVKEQLAIKNKKRKKLDLVMNLFLKKSKITNDEVEKFLHVSDATAERYLNALEKENKIKQTGRTGHSVFYQKVI